MLGVSLADSAVLMLPDEFDHTGKWWVTEALPVGYFVFIKQLAVISGCRLNGVVFGLITLKNHFGAATAAPSPPCDLGEELVGAFGGAHIG